MDENRDIIKNLEDALKLVDESGLSPAPTPAPGISAARSTNAQRNSSVPESLITDKYGIPIDFSASPPKPAVADTTTQGIPYHSISSLEKRTAITSSADSLKTSSLRSVTPTGTAGVPAKVKSYDILPSGKMRRSRKDEPELDIGSEDFKMKFDFESAYRDVPEDKPFRLRREKRTGLVGGILLAVFIICVSIVLASIAWMAAVDVLGFASEDEEINVHVPPGFTLEGIADMLYESGLIRHRALFMLYAEYSNAIDKISEGTYVLNKNFDYRALVQGMTARAGVRVETTVTIPEGFTLAQIFSLLEAEGVTPAADLWEAATYHDFGFFFLDRETLGDRLRLEGFLFPETYNFFMDSTAVQTISRMLREFNRRFTEEYIERADDMGYTVRDIVIIASMIEREAGTDEERPRIAAVIYNRLDSPDFPNLQIDATIDYARAGTGRPFSIQFESPFNTYIHPGLPPGPIGNPGILSIRAALFPQTTNEYFYALNREGSHNFFTNYNDHRNFVNSDEFGG
jgi:UPF0755 protein